MSHMVIYRSSDGKPGYQQVEELEEAIRFVERLRNEQGVTDAKLFDLVEVPISFKAYYQVEVGSRGAVEVSSSPADPAPAPAPGPAAPPAASASASSPEPVKAVAAEPVSAEPAVPAAVKPGAPVAAAAAASKPEEKGDPSSNGGRFGLFGKS